MAAVSPPAVATPLSKAAYFLSLLALSMGGFAIGTSEFAGMGLMPDIGHALAISEPQVGHLISAYALGVVVGAPLLAVLGAGLSRKRLLLSLMGFYALGNLASALAPGYQTMLLFRFIAGLPHGAYFGVAALAAAAISRPDRRAAAVSRVLMGLTIAMLIGNPLATRLGQVLDWRYAFALVSLIALLTVTLLALFLPQDRVPARTHPLHELRAFNRAPVWFALGIAATGFAGMFCVFSYLAPLMLHVTRVQPGWIAVGLAAIGCGGIVGNIAGGWLFDRLRFRATALVLLWSIAVLLVFPFAAQSLWTLLPAAFAVGTMVALSPILQTHLMDVATGAQTLAAASNHAAFNIANALGPWLGGLAIGAGLGWTSTGFVGATTALAGLLIYAAAQRGEQDDPAPATG